ncbi:ester cyclase [Streptomyces sp. Ru71]|uniref:ester cyclase n=1 Tax=Streptomyces sp. Ru71 TaxID=2080746 RepID=UPI000CDE024E|nr:ester cyclase [Streptomyces sp. Ru71]POX55465.1 ester cyclase [Streptomyces sp. Ru71]
MTFVQLIDCKTSRFDEMNRLMDKWVEQTKGKRTATHDIIGKDRSDASHFIEIVEFPSYEEAMQNSNLPETDKIFREMVALCDEMPTFTDLDVVREDQLNAATVRTLFERMAGKGEVELDDIVSDDYRDHDPAKEEVDIGRDGFRRDLQMWRDAFDFSFRIDDQITEGDRVCSRWTWQGTQKAEFMGVPSSGDTVTMTGVTIYRVDGDGRVCEGWWEYDRAGLMEQLGVLGD